MASIDKLFSCYLHIPIGMSWWLFVFVCMVTNFSGEDKASGVKFCTVVYGRPGHGISHFGEICSPQKPKIGWIGHPPGSKVQGGKSFRNCMPVNMVRCVDVGSVYVDIQPSPKTDVLVRIYIVANDGYFSCVTVVKQRMQVFNSPYKSCIDCIRSIHHSEGIWAFYRSYGTQLTMNVPFVSLHFVIYESAQDFLNPSRQYNPLSHVISGAAAGSVAAAATTPLDVCKTLLNTQAAHATGTIGTNAGFIVNGLMQAFATVYHCRGVRGYFSGVTARVVFQMPATAISWTVYEFFKFAITHYSHHDASSSTAIPVCFLDWRLHFTSHKASFVPCYDILLVKYFIFDNAGFSRWVGACLIVLWEVRRSYAITGSVFITTATVMCSMAHGLLCLGWLGLSLTMSWENYCQFSGWVIKSEWAIKTCHFTFYGGSLYFSYQWKRILYSGLMTS